MTKSHTVAPTTGGHPVSPTPHPTTGAPTTTPPTTADTTPPAPAVLHAYYQTLVDPVDGAYTGKIIISNTGGTTASGWTVTIYLPGDEMVTAAQGAQFDQPGSPVTFTPDGSTQIVPAGKSMSFTFNVTGTTSTDPPSGCLLNGGQC
jgi:hypothetical protein